MKTKLFALLAFGVALPLVSFAHGDHPEAKGDVPAPNGGLIQPADENIFMVPYMERVCLLKKRIRLIFRKLLWLSEKRMKPKVLGK